MTEPRKPRKTVDLSAHAGLFQLHREAKEAIKGWQAVMAGYEKKIKELFGDNEAAFCFGNEVATFGYVDRWASAQFAKDEPDIARVYERQVVKTELDVEAIKREQPDLYERYRVKALSNKGL